MSRTDLKSIMLIFKNNTGKQYATDMPSSIFNFDTFMENKSQQKCS